MAVNKAKLIKLRNNIEAYLSRLEKEDKMSNMDKIVADIIDTRLYNLKDDLDMKLQDAMQTSQASSLNTEAVVGAIEHLGKKIGSLNVELPEFPDTSEKIVEAISNIRFPEVNFPNTISVDNFPPQKIPQPVTNININGLRGPVKSTALTVGSTATPLPASPLANRRSLIVWNNDNSTTLWIGGEDVSVANGIPVKKQNYSPALDLGDKVFLYGITDGASIDVRVLESSMSAEGQ